MKYDLSIFDRIQADKAKDKVIELRQEQIRLPYTTVPIGDKTAYMAFKAAKLVREAHEREERQKAWTEKRERIAAKLYAAFKDMLTVTEEKVEASKHNECECGARACGSNAHSSWCPTFAYQFKRKKESDNTGYDNT